MSSFLVASPSSLAPATLPSVQVVPKSHLIIIMMIVDHDDGDRGCPQKSAAMQRQPVLLKADKIFQSIHKREGWWRTECPYHLIQGGAEDYSLQIGFYFDARDQFLADLKMIFFPRGNKIYPARFCQIWSIQMVVCPKKIENSGLPPTILFGGDGFPENSKVYLWGDQGG